MFKVNTEYNSIYTNNSYRIMINTGNYINSKKSYLWSFNAFFNLIIIVAIIIEIIKINIQKLAASISDDI